MASKNKQERRRLRAKTVNRESQRDKLGAEAATHFKSGQTAQNENVNGCRELVEELLGGRIYQIGHPQTPWPLQLMDKAMKADDESLFTLSLIEMRQEVLELFNLKMFPKAGGLVMDVFEYAIHRRCINVFGLLVNMAKETQETFERLLDVLCARIEACGSWDRGKDYAAWIYGEIARCIMLGGVELAGPGRSGYCGLIWDEVAIEVEAERQQAELQAAILEVGRGGAGSPQLKRL